MEKLKSTYDISKDYLFNVENGPFFEGPFPEKLKEEPLKLFDVEVAFPLGVPAGLLLNGRWVLCYARLGYPVVVYKTVRSKKHPCHPWPNCLFVKTSMIDPYNPPDTILAPSNYTPEDPKKITITNSFGMPSMDPRWWQEDIDRLKSELPKGTLLIGSCVGTYTGTSWELKRDFARCAAMLKEAGVQAVELNLSCPNVGNGEGSIYTDPDLSREILQEVRREVKGIPLLVKIGLLLGKKLEEFVKACVFYVEGIAGVNSLQARVVREDGSPALGKDREKSGVCGWALRRCALEFTRQLSQLKKELKAEFLIFTSGGVTDRESFFMIREAGADVVMTCTAAMFNPLLAREIRKP